jgi:hypothetical protein
MDWLHEVRQIQINASLRSRQDEGCREEVRGLLLWHTGENK